MCDISRSFRRQQVVDYSDYLYADEHTFVAQRPSGLHDVANLAYLLEPFNLPIWALFLVTLFCFFAVIALTTVERKERLGRGFLLTVSIFLLQCK